MLWQKVVATLEKHLSPEKAIQAAQAFEDHCIERAAVPSPVWAANETKEEHMAKVQQWAIDTHSVGKANLIAEIIPDFETRKAIVNTRFMGLVRDSCPVQ